MKIALTFLLLCCLTVLSFPQTRVMGGGAKIGGQGIIRRGAGGGGGGDTGFVYDTFTATDGTLLTAHTPDNGSSWISGAFDQSGFGGYLRNSRMDTAGDFCRPYNNATPPSADYDIIADVIFNTQTGYGGVLARIDTTPGGEDWYAVRWLSASDQWVIEEVNAGNTSAPTTLGTPYSDSPADGTTRTIRFRLTGSALELEIDGVSRISTTDSTITAAGKVGITLNAASDTTGLNIDRYWAGPNGGSRP